MRGRLLACGVLLLAIGAGAEEPPKAAPIPPSLGWAYPRGLEKEPYPAPAADTVYRVKGSALSFTGAELEKLPDAVDWLPAEHPANPPDVVLHGDQSKKREACASCHGHAGQGFLEIPSLAGLPAGYIAEQLHEFQAGRRASADPDREVASYMAEIAKVLSEKEIQEAAAYFASLGKRSLPVRVVEADQAPAVRDDYHGWMDIVPNGGTQPTGRRVVLVAEDFMQQWVNDPHSGNIAYVPTGAVARGKALAHRGRQACVSCHGPDLKGLGAAPALAGRDPHYLARQLWDIKSGARKGPTVALMQKPAAGVAPDEIVDLVAYIASLKP